MTPEEFNKKLAAKQKQVKQYAERQFPVMAGNTALRFVDGNFRAQGFQGRGFKRWKENARGGTILVSPGGGSLRAATYVTFQIAMATLRNNMKYAKVHNEGFKGSVTVKAHSRNRMGKIKVGTGRFNKSGKERMITKTTKIGQSSVKAHTRQMNIAQRQFMPIRDNDSPTLVRAIERQVSKDLINIVKS